MFFASRLKIERLKYNSKLCSFHPAIFGTCKALFYPTPKTATFGVFYFYQIRKIMAKVNWRNTNILFDVLHKFNLSLTQYVIADIIARQSAQFNGWTSIADGSLAEILKVSRPTISDNIDKLVELGLIAKREGGGNGMHVPKKATELWWAAVNEVEDYKKDTCKETLHPCKETLQPCKKSLQGCKVSLHYSNSIDNNINNTTTFSKEKDSSEKTEVFSPAAEKKKIAANSNVKKTLFSQDENQTEKEKNCGKKEKAETPEMEAKPTRTKFIKPTVEEIEAYCAENNFPVDANSFIDHYIANGWKVGNNPMKDWKATVRNWARKNFSNQNNNSKPNQNYKQNATNQSNTKPNAKPDANTVARVLDRDREINELGY